MEKRELTYRVYGVLEQSGICQVGTMELDGEDKVIFLKTGLSDYEARGKKFRTKLDIISKSDLDKYLCSNGYSKKVVSGTYKIPVGADNETIAKIITKNR